MGAKHTQGPWVAFDHTCGVGVSAAFADVAHCIGFDSRRCRDEEVANARLIASAPDLLEALVRIRDGSHEHSSVYSVALAAISKATGDA
jgi:hypothetical protein